MTESHGAVEPELPGCGWAAAGTLTLLGIMAVMWWAGFTMVDGDTCTGLCETTGLTLLFAGAPISALVTTLGGDLVVAWPLEFTLWIVVGPLLVRQAARRPPIGPRWARLVGVVVLTALGYGLVLGRFVELTG